MKGRARAEVILRANTSGNPGRILDVLDAGGYAVVELPEPHSKTSKEHASKPFLLAWQWRGFDIAAEHDCVGFRYLDPPFDFDVDALEPDDVRNFAAALLAAADAAERAL